MGDLVAQGDVLFGQGLEAAVILHVLPDLVGLVLGNALGELFALEEALEDEIRAAFDRGFALGTEELLAQGAAAKAVNGVHLLEEVLPLLEELIEVGFHLAILYLYRYNTQGQNHHPA